MLGHGPLGQWALGQLPGVDAVAAGAALDLDLALVPGAATGGVAGDALAPGASLDLALSLDAGAATGERQITFLAGRRPQRIDARARGAEFDLYVSFLPGLASGDRHIDAVTTGAALPSLTVRIAAGAATGEATGYDNDFVLLLAA